MKNTGLSFNQKLDYYKINEGIDILSQKYPFLSVTSIGQTVLGKRIPMLSIGRGKKTVLYVGTQAGTDVASASCLLRYAEELCGFIANDTRIYNCSSTYMFATRTVTIVPMLNPDGVDYCINGIDPANPLYERFNSSEEMRDFSKWKGNALGVELRNNYGESFDDIESKECAAESGALRNYLMFNGDIKLVLTLSKGANGVIHTYSKNAPPRLNSLGRAIANFCDTTYFQTEDIGTLCGFCAKELGTPCYEVNSEYTNENDTFADYVRLRKALFLAPTLI